MGRLAVYKFAYLLSIIFTLLIFCRKNRPRKQYVCSLYCIWKTYLSHYQYLVIFFIGLSDSGIGYGFRYLVY